MRFWCPLSTFAAASWQRERKRNRKAPHKINRFILFLSFLTFCCVHSDDWREHDPFFHTCFRTLPTPLPTAQGGRRGGGDDLSNPYGPPWRFFFGVECIDSVKPCPARNSARRLGKKKLARLLRCEVRAAAEFEARGSRSRPLSSQMPQRLWLVKLGIRCS